MGTWAQRIGVRAKRIRQAKGLGFEVVARSAKLGIGALSEIENGKREARISGYARLAKALGVTLADLLGLDGDREGDGAGEGR